MKKPLACYLGFHSLTHQGGFRSFWFCQRLGCAYGYPPEWTEHP